MEKEALTREAALAWLDTASRQRTGLPAAEVSEVFAALAIDLSLSGTPTPGTDQITRTETIPTLDVSGNPVWRTTARVWQQNDAGALVSQTERTPDGLQSWSWQIGQGPTPTDPDETFTQQGAKYTHTLTDLKPAIDKAWTTTATHPDNTQTIQTYTNGLLDTVDQGIHSTTYGYEDATNGIPGRLRTTTDSRTGTTTINYISTTADVVASITDPGTRTTYLTYDQRGRRTHVDAPNTFDPDAAPENTDHENITITAYNPATLALDTETITTNGHTRVIDRSQDTLGRDEGWQLLNGTNVENEVEYRYHADHGRLHEVESPAGTFTYTYVEDSLNLPATVTGPLHSVTNTWSPTRNVLLSKENETLDSTPDLFSGYTYTVNEIGQRETVVTDGSAYSQTNRGWTWDYDALGQVISAENAADTTHHRAYDYDAIGNRLASVEGTLDLQHHSATSYTPNALNQYSSWGLGSSPSYDWDGNATYHPLPVDPGKNFTLVWDGENRLIEVIDGSTSLVSYAYDAQSRRVVTSVGSTNIVTFYDQWNPIVDLKYQQLARAYTWGPDLSGSLQGAGGVGGLLALDNKLGGTGNSGLFFPLYDGNGNVTQYIRENNPMQSGITMTSFEYDPFGQVVASSEDSPGVADYLTHRFSTKPQDAQTGLLYYGFRYYDPLTGRWLNRDPIEERGGLNLYGFVGNDGVNWVDLLGMATIFPTPTTGDANRPPGHPTDFPWVSRDGRYRGGPDQQNQGNFGNKPPHHNRPAPGGDLDLNDWRRPNRNWNTGDRPRGGVTRPGGGGLGDLAGSVADYYSNRIEMWLRLRLEYQCRGKNSSSPNAERACCVATFTLLRNNTNGRMRLHPDSGEGSISIVKGDCSDVAAKRKKYGELTPAPPGRTPRWRRSPFRNYRMPAESSVPNTQLYQICYEF